MIQSADGSWGASVLAETSLGASSGRFNVKVKSVRHEVWRWHEAMVAPDDGLVKSDMTELCSCCIACEFLCLKERERSWARSYLAQETQWLGSIRISYCVDQKKKKKKIQESHCQKLCLAGHLVPLDISALTKVRFWCYTCLERLIQLKRKRFCSSLNNDAAYFSSPLFLKSALQRWKIQFGHFVLWR